MTPACATTITLTPCAAECNRNRANEGGRRYEGAAYAIFPSAIPPCDRVGHPRMDQSGGLNSRYYDKADPGARSWLALATCSGTCRPNFTTSVVTGALDALLANRRLVTLVFAVADVALIWLLIKVFRTTFQHD
ncbi:hypothetical protein VOLCADRAFT_98722 [Volvox carteri f. nagariensis]|uniref:Uncharacterized protein n=1 Tax=Volvox carteri f. nagariensis TaxID=3068 RepID=D8UG41_VOLCA|nr:uncharacterized protein VOLCADRAFT_98722 [Volvox carteri f. nagariensis]EFJ41311.1 hypothetical protein VOLCADRAFT_98722 [Volvox carteri f. nagariensis]|eukprot:XP_002957645.1 hypothetical protein VOLCADRAFT_98722 [Volvox carteri f. nagariensis]